MHKQIWRLFIWKLIYHQLGSDVIVDESGECLWGIFWGVIECLRAGIGD